MQEELDPDVSWVARLANVGLTRAAAAVEAAVGETALFRHIRTEHIREGRASYVEIDAPLELYALARLLRPRHILEVGVSSGVSSAYLLQALARNRRGTLHSIDRPAVARRTRSGEISRHPSWSLPDGRSSGWATPSRLRDGWDLRLGDKRELIPAYAREALPSTLFVYDVPHDDDDAAREFALLDRSFPSGSVLIADHGPGGGLCPSLSGWATRRAGQPIGRAGLGLYGFHAVR